MHHSNPDCCANRCSDGCSVAQAVGLLRLAGGVVRGAVDGQGINAFDKYGLAVDIQYIETATAVPAIVANNIDAEEVSAAPIITADANGDLDLVLIGSALNHPILALYTVAEITNAEQLRGKVVATDKPGTPADYAARLALSLLELTTNDVDYRVVGSAAEVTPAMLSGQVPAGVVAPPQSFQVKAKGFHLLQGIFDQPYQNVGVVAGDHDLTN